MLASYLHLMLVIIGWELMSTLTFQSANKGLRGGGEGQPESEPKAEVVPVADVSAHFVASTWSKTCTHLM